METEPNLAKVAILSSLDMSLPVASWGSGSDTFMSSHTRPLLLHIQPLPHATYKQSKYFPGFQEEKPLRNQYQNTNKILFTSQFTCLQWLYSGFNSGSSAEMHKYLRYHSQGVTSPSTLFMLIFFFSLAFYSVQAT